jgi:hypothetical protein
MQYINPELGKNPAPQVIVFEMPDKSIKVLHPRRLERQTDNGVLILEETNLQDELKLAKLREPDAVRYSVYNREDLPEYKGVPNRVYRNQWKWNVDDSITADVEQCKTTHLKRLRYSRQFCLNELDNKLKSPKADVTSLNIEVQKLRDAPQTIELDTLCPVSLVFPWNDEVILHEYYLLCQLNLIETKKLLNIYDDVNFCIDKIIKLNQYDIGQQLLDIHSNRLKECGLLSN